MKDWRQYDFEIAMATWLIAMAATYLSYIALPAAILATFNFWHQRRTLHDFGRAFAERVREVLGDDLRKFRERMVAMEKAVEDVKEAQVNIAGAWRGKRP